jgi:hypothetical protein
MCRKRNTCVDGIFVKRHLTSKVNFLGVHFGPIFHGVFHRLSQAVTIRDEKAIDFFVGIGPVAD